MPLSMSCFCRRPPPLVALRSLLVPVLLATSSERTRAQEAGSADPAVVELDRVVVTATRRPDAAPVAAVTVVDEDRLQDLHPEVATDVLRGTPGVFLEANGPGQGNVVVRGLKGSEVLHLVDGMRLNSAFFRAAPSQFEAVVDPFNLARVEVRRGPSATLYGSDAMGGVVQFLTPEERFSGADWQGRGSFRALYGSADDTTAGRVQGAFGTEKFSFSAGLSGQDVGPRRTAFPSQSANRTNDPPRTDTPNGTAFTTRGTDAKALWKPFAGQELMASWQDYSADLPSYNEVVPGYAAARGQDEAILKPRRRFEHLRYVVDNPWAGVVDRVEAHLARQWLNDDRHTLPVGTPVVQDEINVSRLDGLTLEAVSTPGPHTLTYGLDLYHDMVVSQRQNITPAGASSVTAGRYPDGGRTSSLGIYLTDQWRLLRTVTADLGGRVTRTDTTVPVVPSPAGPGVGAQLSDTSPTGQAGLAWRFAPGFTLAGTAARSFRSPDLNDLAQFGPRPNNRYSQPNPDLKPEILNGYDLSLRYRRGILSTELTGFYNDYRDRITVVPTGNLVGTRIETQSRNISRARYYGVESGLTLKLLPTLTARATLNWTFATQDIQGTKVPGNRTPPLNGFAGLDYGVTPTWLLGASVLWAGRQDRLDPTDLADSRIDPGGTGGYAVWNLSTTYAPLAQPWRLRLEANNLLDKAWREHASGIDGPGRGVVANLDARF